jgi:tetratricopeptide (TPR) repeat protein
MADVTPPPLERLLGFLQTDPQNLRLLGDAAAAAVEAKDYAQADKLLGRFERLAALPPRLANLKGIAALAQKRYAGAAAIFKDLREKSGDAPALKFNLAWALAMQDDYRGALDLLDDDTLDASSRAPALKIHAMHHLGLYADALECGAVLAGRFPDNEELMGALATLALDAERSDLALQYGGRAGANAEGRAALGFLTLGDHDSAKSSALFEQALAAQPANPRAWVGKGLSLLAAGDARSAAKAIDRGAALFGDHIGSWIASGWVHFVSGENAKARQSFERALAIDPNFSECHGGLAVLDILDGKIDEAKRRADVALRLDRNCFGGALAKSLLLAQGGHVRAAQAVRDAALSTPIGAGGRTVAREIAAFGMLPRKSVPPMNGEDRKRPG